jgi:hypothetical protein
MVADAVQGLKAVVPPDFQSFSLAVPCLPLTAEAIQEAEALAEQGEVDQAQALQAQAEALNKQHDEMLKRLTTPEKTMIVCDICGVFINSTDNESRRRVSNDCSCMGPRVEHACGGCKGRAWSTWAAVASAVVQDGQVQV